MTTQENFLPTRKGDIFGSNKYQLSLETWECWKGIHLYKLNWYLEFSLYMCRQLLVNQLIFKNSESEFMGTLTWLDRLNGIIRKEQFEKENQLSKLVFLKTIPLWKSSYCGLCTLVGLLLCLEVFTFPHQKRHTSSLGSHAMHSLDSSGEHQWLHY